MGTVTALRRGLAGAVVYACERCGSVVTRAQPIGVRWCTTCARRECGRRSRLDLEHAACPWCHRNSRPLNECLACGGEELDCVMCDGTGIAPESRAVRGGG